jgi:epoxyqueuosine reductase
VFLFSYQEAKKYLLDNDEYRVAAYALGFQGEDYHFALQRRLDEIFSQLKRITPSLEYKLSLDIQPVLERDLAYRAGLGWFGKNSMLINQKEGSYFLIGSLLLNQKLPLELPVLDIDHCGQCNACVEACPTQAIDPKTRTLIAKNCISTFTIETFKESSPPEGFEKSRGEVFGCDICQDVCPWNKKPMLRIVGQLELATAFAFIKKVFLDSSLDQLKDFLQRQTNRGFQRLTRGTALDRPGRKGWLKNLVSLIDR